MDAVAEAFARRLDHSARIPLVVGFSGGSDSTALLVLTIAWARRHGRRVVAMTVDHGLQSQSAAWTERAARVARRLGAEPVSLRWTGDKPITGLPAAARSARHRLMADAARAIGARAILLGHTRDDVHEGELMRRSGSTLGRLKEWAPSPVWPQGRGLFHFRPLLGLGREELRDRLRAEGLDWIEDPANADMRYARPRARAALASGAAPGSVEPPPDAVALTGQVRADRLGGLVGPRQVLAQAGALAPALTCVGGKEAPPRGQRVQALAARLAAEETFVTTLAGCRVMVGEEVKIVREPGEARRGGLAPVVLQSDAPAVWDGRFEMRMPDDGWTVRPLAGLGASLPRGEHEYLRMVPVAQRGALPLLMHSDGRTTCPLLAEAEGTVCTSLVGDRFAAACGAFAREAV